MRLTASLIKPGAIIVLCMALAGCGDRRSQPGDPAVPVKAAMVVKKEVPFKLSAIGVVEPSLGVSVMSQVGGSVKEVHFTEGQEVKQGDLLFTIDPAPFEARLRQAQANLARAQAEADNARSQLRRYQELVGREFVTREKYDEANASALAQQAMVRAAEAAVENARLELGYTAIRSPINGRSGDLLVKPGNVVKANELSTPLVRINQLKPSYVRFSVPEQELPVIREQNARGAMQVIARVKGTGGREVTGRLTFIDNAVDRSTGTILLKGTFENSDEFLWPGQFVEAQLVVRNEINALVVPSEAVQTGQIGNYTWVVKPDMGVEIRKITQAFVEGQETVVSAGLSEGERVVTDGQLRLSPQSKVRIKTTEDR